jgi:hypothetical protein
MMKPDRQPPLRPPQAPSAPAHQRWFWGERWQEMEREVDAHVSAGRVVSF